MHLLSLTQSNIYNIIKRLLSNDIHCRSFIRNCSFSRSLFAFLLIIINRNQSNRNLSLSLHKSINKLKAIENKTVNGKRQTVKYIKTSIKMFQNGKFRKYTLKLFYVTKINEQQATSYEHPVQKLSSKVLLSVNCSNVVFARFF